MSAAQERKKILCDKLRFFWLWREIEPNEVWKGVYVRIGPIAVTSPSRIPTREVPRVSGGISVTPRPGPGP